MCKQTRTKAHTICDTGLGNNPVERIDKGLKERTTGVNVNVSALDKIKAVFGVSTDKGLKMDSSQRLELAKLYFDLRKNNIAVIMGDSRAGYQSLLDDVNKQIATAEDQLNQIEEELKQVDNPDHKKSLKEKEQEVKREFQDL
jgi:hypothetical protein